MSTVLVTGGAGYIGSHAAKALAQAGHDVVVYDNLSAGHAEAVTRLARAFPTRSVTLVEGDILDQGAVVAALRASGSTAVMHFAARLSVGESVQRPGLYYQANVAGAISVLGAMADAGVRHLVFSSTCATFGEPLTDQLDESHPQRPINAYGETKLAIERALPHFERAHGIQSVVLRYFNAAGADPDGLLGEDHQPEEHLIPRALAATEGGAPLTVFGEDYPTPDGTCIRDYVHVSDLAVAHVAALDCLRKGGGSNAYNLGYADGVSVREVLASVERVTGRPVAHTMGPRRPGDPARLVAANAKAVRELAWAVQPGQLDRIVQTAWHWHRTHPRGYRSPAS